MGKTRGGRANRVLYLLYQPYKYLVFLPLLLFFTGFYVGLGAVIVFLFDDNMANRTTGVWWARTISSITPMRVKVIGRENIEKGQSYIVASNHQSSFDIFVLYGWLGFDLKWVIKRELLKYPVFGYAVKAGGNIVIDRSHPQKAIESIEKARHRIRDGVSIIMLPEGTRSRTGQLGEFKKGAFVLAREMGLPILPVTIANTRYVLPPKTLDLFPGRTVMKIHPPVHLAAYEGEPLDKLMGDVREIIGEGLREYQR
jgi:1-acyl-sn-glycerol-3-phosphate acyltransferase